MSKIEIHIIVADSVHMLIVAIGSGVGVDVLKKGFVSTNYNMLLQVC